MPAEAAERDRETGLARFLRGCPDPLCQAYDVALLDLDGVVYLGGRRGARRAAGAGQGGGRRHAAGVRDQQLLPDPVGDRRPGRQLRRPGRRRRRGHLGPGRRHPAGRTAGPRLGRAGGGRQRAARRGPRPGLPAGDDGPGPARGGRPGVRPVDQLLAAVRGRAGRRGRRLVRGLERGRDHADRARAAARQRRALPGDRGRRPGSSRWSRASPNRRCTPRRWRAPAPGTRW